MNLVKISAYLVLAFLTVPDREAAWAVDSFAPPPGKEVRQKLEAAIIDPASRFQENGGVLIPEEAAAFHTTTLDISESKSTHEPLVLFCGTFSEPQKQPDIEDNISSDICGVFNLKTSVVYILSNKARQNLTLRRFQLSKSTDYILMDGGCGDSCDWEGATELFAYNSNMEEFEKIWAINTYERRSADGPDSTTDYIDRGTLSEGERENEGMKEIVLSIKREDRYSEPPQKVKEIKEWYSWRNGAPYLVQRTENDMVVLDRAAGERMYAVLQINVSTAALGKMGLIDYLGDENQLVAVAAEHAIYTYMYSLGNTGKDYPMLRELLHRSLDSKSPCRSLAGNLIYNFSSFNGFSLAKEDRDLLWDALRGAPTNVYVIFLLSEVGDGRIAPVLVARFKDSIERRNACSAAEALSPVYTAAEHGVKFPADFIEYVEKAAGLGLQCKDGEVEFDLADNIRSVLPLLSVGDMGR